MKKRLLKKMLKKKKVTSPFWLPIKNAMKAEPLTNEMLQKALDSMARNFTTDEFPNSFEDYGADGLTPKAQ